MHYIAYEIDGKLTTLNLIRRDIRESEDYKKIKIYCYYLDENGKVIKDGEEILSTAMMTQVNYYKDGIKDDSLSKTEIVTP